jgi:predicted nucleotidyltransferase
LIVKPSVALEANQAAIREAVRRFNTRNPRVFGSVLRGEDKDGGDLDLLVDPLPGVTLFDLGGLQVELEEMLGVPVELLTPDDLPLKYRQKVLLEALPI